MHFSSTIEATSQTYFFLIDRFSHSYGSQNEAHYFPENYLIYPDVKNKNL